MSTVSKRFQAQANEWHTFSPASRSRTLSGSDEILTHLANSGSQKNNETSKVKNFLVVFDEFCTSINNEDV